MPGFFPFFFFGQQYPFFFPFLLFFFFLLCFFFCFVFFSYKALKKFMTFFSIWRTKLLGFKSSN
ncbi:hypothetical protein D7D81_08040 [Halocella sp. SP3-1]|nr:hypothetical protein D7D81_08040 [Halocella sp. SP3-1]